MDQIDLNIGIPLLVQDQNETVVYMDSPGVECDSESVIFKNNEALIINDENETLLINSDSIIDNSIVKSKTIIINEANLSDEKGKNEEIIIENGKCEESELDSESRVLTDEMSEDAESQNDSTVLIQTVESTQLYVDGEPVQLLDGNIIDGSESIEENVCNPTKLYNGNVIYVVPSNLLSPVTCLEEENKGENGGKDAKGSGSNVEESGEKTKGFRCSVKNCNKIYANLHHLKVHQRAHTGDRPFRCSVEGCNKAFSTSFGLKTHFRTHNGERPYMCNHSNCEKGFKTSGDLQKHIRTHTGERPFVCPIPNCGRSFTTCNICKVHIRTHTGERPYKCTYPNCSKTFASVTNQRNHMRIHSGEKPYVCPVEKCGKRFTEYSSLYKHNMVHRQQPHLCLICGKTYKQAAGLMVHMKAVHNERKDSFYMVDKSPSEDVSQDESTAVFLVDNIELEDGDLEDPLFSDLRESAPLNV